MKNQHEITSFFMFKFCCKSMLKSVILKNMEKFERFLRVLTTSIVSQRELDLLDNTLSSDFLNIPS